MTATVSRVMPATRTALEIVILVIAVVVRTRGAPNSGFDSCQLHFQFGCAISFTEKIYTDRRNGEHVVWKTQCIEEDGDGKKR